MAILVAIASRLPDAVPASARSDATAKSNIRTRCPRSRPIAPTTATYAGMTVARRCRPVQPGRPGDRRSCRPAGHAATACRAPSRAGAPGSRSGPTATDHADGLLASRRRAAQHPPLADRRVSPSASKRSSRSCASRRPVPTRSRKRASVISPAAAHSRARRPSRRLERARRRSRSRHRAGRAARAPRGTARARRRRPSSRAPRRRRARARSAVRLRLAPAERRRRAGEVELRAAPLEGQERQHVAGPRLGRQRDARVDRVGRGDPRASSSSSSSSQARRERPTAPRARRRPAPRRGRGGATSTSTGAWTVDATSPRATSAASRSASRWRGGAGSSNDAAAERRLAAEDHAVAASCDDRRGEPELRPAARRRERRARARAPSRRAPARARRRGSARAPRARRRAGTRPGYPPGATSASPRRDLAALDAREAHRDALARLRPLDLAVVHLDAPHAHVAPAGSSRSSSPAPIEPDQSVPVTTVPIPRSVNERST